MFSDVIHPDVVAVTGLLEDFGIGCSPGVSEPDNAEYGAMVCGVGSSTMRIRVGKVTPTKVGLFVSVWRRAADGSTEPFPVESDVDALVVVAREGDRYGAFVFPVEVLATRGVVSAGGVGGKRGFRVYPPWSATGNPQARRSQSWQCDWFLDMSGGTVVDPRRAGRLFLGG